MSGMVNSDRASATKKQDIDSVIGELCLLAPTEEIKKCLQIYQYGKDLSKLKKEFTLIRKPILEDTLSFLQVPDQEDYLKPTNVHNLICKIQNLLPEKCTICEDSYCVRLEDNALLECVMCGQDVRRKCFLQKLGAVDPNMDAATLATIINPYRIKNLYYLCDPCADENLPKNEAGKKKKKRQRDLTNIETTEDKHSDKVNLEEPAETQKENYNITPNEGKNTRVTLEETEQTKGTEDKLQPKTKTCSYYVRGKCKHGIKGKNCLFNHPRACKKFMKHGTRTKGGCQEGRKCPFFHPKMCFSSLRKGECFDKKCQLTHVKGTKRNHQTYDNTQSFNKDDYHLDHQQENRQQHNKEMDFLAVLQKLKKDIMEEMEQKMINIINNNTAKMEIPPMPTQQLYPQTILNNKPNWAPQSINWGMTPPSMMTQTC